MIDIIDEKIDVKNHIQSLPVISEADIPTKSEPPYEYKPTMVRYIRRMVDPPDLDFSYTGYARVCDTMNSRNASSLPAEPDNNSTDLIFKETVRRLQKTKIPSDSYPFRPLNTGSGQQDIKSKSIINENSEELESVDSSEKGTVITNYGAHFLVQTFIILLICIFITSISCAACYAQSWGEVVNELQNDLNLSFLDVLSAFSFEEGIISANPSIFKEGGEDEPGYLQYDMKEVNYGKIQIKDGLIISEEIIVNSKLFLCYINFTVDESDRSICLSIPIAYPALTITNAVSNICLFDLSESDATIGGKLYPSNIQGLKIISHLNRRSKVIESDKNENNNNEINNFLNTKENNKTQKNFVLLKDAFYASLLKNGDLIFLQKSQQNFSSILLAAEVDKVDILLDKFGRAVFLYVDKKAKIWIGSCFDERCSRIRKVLLEKLRIHKIQNIRLELSQFGLPILHFNSDIDIFCSHKMCYNDVYP